MIRRELHDEVWVVTLDRADRRNALTPEMLAELDRAIQGTPPHARAILLAGAGTMMCSGFDLKLCVEHPGTLETLLRGLSAIVARLRWGQDHPVVVAAQGGAIAGGCALLGAGDLVVADKHAKIGYPVTPLGISPAVSAAFLRRCVSDGKARERLLDPALISGQEAARIGLVHACVESSEHVLPKAMELAIGLAKKPREAIRETRRWMREIEIAVGSRTTGQDAARALEASLTIIESPEQRERLAAMLASKK